ncbi:hypothetical protein [Nitrospira sp. BLG_2]|uniref:hypothetical protein n=1 Tax=Nitrospira sp. BLG_2 TaxID=3397507 RepID=UPI003B9C4F36
MIEYDKNLQDQLDDLPLDDEDEQNDGPIEPDELDQLISDALDVGDEEDDDDEGEESGDESDDDDDSSDGGSEAELSPSAQVSKKKGRSAQRRAKEAIKRQQLKSELEKTRQEAQQARALAEQERSRAYGMEALIKTISGGASMDEILALAANNGVQAPQQPNTQDAPLTPRQLEEWYRNKAALNNEMTNLQSTWLPIHQRVAKTAPHVTSWFDREFTAGIEANPQRRDLLKAIADFSYPMEAAYAASKKEGFERLSQGEQIALINRCDKKIAEMKKPEPTRQKREALKTPSSSSVNSRLPAEKISNEEWFNRMHPIPK